MGSHNRVAIVTGAGTGIGKNAALTLLADGYRVGLVGRRKELLAKTVEDAGPAAANTLVLPADVASPESVKALFAKVLQAWGRLDVLFNNAGMGAPAIPMEDLSFEQWKAVVDVNLSGMFLCSQEAIKIMKNQDPRGGRIINNGSIFGARTAAQLGALHSDQACGHRPDQVHLARLPEVRYRLRSDRHRQCRDGNDRAHEKRRGAGERFDGDRAAHGRGARRQRRALHGEPAAGRERAVHDHHGDENAVRRPRLIGSDRSRRGDARDSSITCQISICPFPFTLTVPIDLQSN